MSAGDFCTVFNMLKSNNMHKTKNNDVKMYCGHHSVYIIPKANRSLTCLQKESREKGVKLIMCKRCIMGKQHITLAMHILRKTVHDLPH